MSDDHTAVDRGLRAEALLQNELIAEAFEVLDRRIYDAFKAAPSRDAEAREYLAKLLHVARDFRAYFEETVLLGENAAARIRDGERQGKIKQLFG